MQCLHVRLHFIFDGPLSLLTISNFATTCQLNLIRVLAVVVSNEVQLLRYCT